MLAGGTHPPPAAYAILGADRLHHHQVHAQRREVPLWEEDRQRRSWPADAWNDAVDILSGLAALTAVSVTLYDPQRFLAADHYGGFAVGLVVVFTGLRVARDTGLQLMDTMPDEHKMRTIREVAQEVVGVEGVEKCFARKTGLQYHVDLHLEVDPEITVRSSHDIAEQVRNRIREKLDWVADVLVHVEPRRGLAEERNIRGDARAVSGERIFEARPQAGDLPRARGFRCRRSTDPAPEPALAHQGYKSRWLVACPVSRRRRMPQEPVGAGLDQFMVGIEAGLDAPLLAEMAHGEPRQSYRQRAEDHGQDQ